MTPTDIEEACDALLVLHRILERKPTLLDVQPIVDAYRKLPGNLAGGSLHILLDNGNVNDDHIEFCIETATEKGDVPGIQLARVLKVMSKTQRARL